MVRPKGNGLENTFPKRAYGFVVPRAGASAKHPMSPESMDFPQKASNFPEHAMKACMPCKCRVMFSTLYQNLDINLLKSFDVNFNALPLFYTSIATREPMLQKNKKAVHFPCFYIPHCV
uniref:(northern house mosquito) hypothetical protein n=1 Tax=Culex pipiens TaxID=7175 RepID=A0A8D8KGX5_CULPI